MSIKAYLVYSTYKLIIIYLQNQLLLIIFEKSLLIPASFTDCAARPIPILLCSPLPVNLNLRLSSLKA
jgi:hypothetical protein